MSVLLNGSHLHSRHTNTVQMRQEAETLDA
jgi:hypothetical protein